MVYKIFLSPQVKRWAIITFKHDIHELPPELPNDLILRILEIKEISGKCVNFIERKPSAESFCLNESSVNTSRKLLNKRNDIFPVVRYFT